MTENREPFWKMKSLKDLTQEEWESLCDGCGRCCLEKFENRKTGNVYFTVVACRLLDLNTCRCRDYLNRHHKMPDCLQLTPDNIYRKWLPPTCAYRLIAKGCPLPDWHPLISGNPDSVHMAGISVRGFAVSGENVHPDQLEALIFPLGKL